MNNSSPHSSSTLSPQTIITIALAGGLALLLLILILVYVFSRNDGPTRDIAQRIENARQRSEPVSAQELNALYQPPPGRSDITPTLQPAFANLPNVNFRPPVQRASDGKTFLTPGISGYHDPQPPLPGEPWKGIEVVEAFLQKHAAIVDSLYKAAQSNGFVRLSTSFHNLSGAPQETQLLLSMMSFLRLEAHVRAHRGDSAGAVKALRAMKKIANAWELEPLLESQSIRFQADAAASDALLRLAPHLKLAESDLQQFSKMCQDIRLEEGFRRGLLGDRAIKMSFYTDSADQIPADQLREMRVSHSQHFRYMEEVLLQLAPSWAKTLQNFEQLEARYAQEAHEGVQIIEHCQPILLKAARATAKNRAAVLVLAIENYRRKNNRLPQDLKSLVPQELPELPLDPFSEKAFRYSSANRTVTIDEANGENWQVAFPQ